MTRLALDRTRTIARRREEYLGPWLPEPIAIKRGPEEHSEMAESLTLGFLMLLDRLNPRERAVWLLGGRLRHALRTKYQATGKSEPACRPIATRARRRLREERPATPERLDVALLGQLMAAVAAGDLTQTLELLDADVVLLSDGGPGHKAARSPSSSESGRSLRHQCHRRGEVTSLQVKEINGWPALVLEIDGTMPLVITAEQREGKVTHIFFLLNEEELTALSAHPNIS